MPVSVIIPVFNSERTIVQCLEAVFSSDFKEFEVIVVDDKSTDDSLSIVKDFPCRILEAKKTLGKAASRNQGAKEAKGEILIFIDSDITIAKDTISKIVADFQKKPKIAALMGVLSKEHPDQNFFSQYKNLYMNFILNQAGDYVDFIYGSCHAIKKELFKPYDTSYRFGQDTELGLRLSQEGHSILLDKNIEVIHLKRYSLFSFIKNDFSVPFYWSRLFVESGGIRTLLKKKRFFHSSGSQLLSIVTFYLFLSAIFICLWPALGLFLFFLALNQSFFLYLYKQKGIGFALKGILTTGLDTLVMGLGIICGFFSHSFKFLNEKNS